MIRAAVLPPFLLLLVIVQTTLLDLFPLGLVGVEISLIIVVYAGFHLRLLPGGILSFTLGFILDCLTSAIFGLYTFVYIVVFCLAAIAADQVYREKPLLVGAFTGLCVLLEGLVIVLLYRLLLDVDIVAALLTVFLPRALLVGLLSPPLFRLFNRFEVFGHAKDA